MTLFALAVLARGEDEPGVLSDVSKALTGLGCNLEDLFSKPLSGHCATMLTLKSPVGLTDDAFLVKLGEEFKTNAWRYDIWEIQPTIPREACGDCCVVCLSGHDKPGIVMGLTKLLADAAANILSFDAELTGRRADPSYSVRVRARLPNESESDSLERDVHRRVNFELGIAYIARDLDLEYHVNWDYLPPQAT